MQPNRQFQETLRAIYAYWPTITAVYGGVVLLLVVIGVSIQRGWFAFVPISLAIMLILAYLLGGWLWLLYQLYDHQGIRPHDVLFDLGQLTDRDRFVFIDCGRRRWALQLAQRITTGHLTVVDIYNPQLMPSGELARFRQRAPVAVEDPRVTWKDGQFYLLPLPDRSVSTVLLPEVVGQLAQRGDQMSLLAEVYRILQPNGRLLIAEQTRNRSQLIFLRGMNRPTRQEWETTLRQAGFVVRTVREPNGLISCLRADKPTQTEAKQMALQLKYES